jgi:hypothetical protein
MIQHHFFVTSFVAAFGAFASCRIFVMLFHFTSRYTVTVGAVSLSIQAQLGVPAVVVLSLALLEFRVLLVLPLT